MHLLERIHIIAIMTIELARFTHTSRYLIFSYLSIFAFSYRILNSPFILLFCHSVLITIHIYTYTSCSPRFVVPFRNFKRHPYLSSQMRKTITHDILLISSHQLSIPRQLIVTPLKLSYSIQFHKVSFKTPNKVTHMLDSGSCYVSLSQLLKVWKTGFTTQNALIRVHVTSFQETNWYFLVEIVNTESFFFIFITRLVQQSQMMLVQSSIPMLNQVLLGFFLSKTYQW